MADSKTYYWVDQNSNFGAGDSKVTYGEKIPKAVSDKDFERKLGSPELTDCISQSKFDQLLKSGQISTEKTTSKREMNELEKLREEVISLKGSGSEESRLSADLKLANQKISELEEGGSGITQEQLDEAKAELQGALNLIKESLAKIQQGDSKAEIWDAVKSVKDLIEG